MKSNGSGTKQNSDDFFDWDFEVGSSPFSDQEDRRDKTSPADPPRQETKTGADEARTARQRAGDGVYRPEYGRPPRRPAAERENAFNAVAWLLEGATGLMEELQHNDLGLSEEFWTHAYAARQESLLALRAALDDLIERSSVERQKQAERAKRRQRRGGIDIEF
jgi:hypothetical protein